MRTRSLAHRMTTKAVLLALSIAIPISFVAGCQSVPIHNVTDARLTPPPGTNPTLDTISEAIRTAGGRLGWRMEEVRPGVMTGTLTPKPGRMAALSITYDTSAFSIAYKDSKNLKYEQNTIHRRYNRWVMMLETAIKEEVARVTPSR